MSSASFMHSVLVSAKQVLQGDNKQPTSRFSQDYLTGLRGLLVVESFAWLFLRTFVPTVVSGTASGPLYQVVIRKVFSVLFWNYSLIYSFFIILSARTVCIHFLHEPSPMVYARSLISRPLRVGIPISIALTVSISIFSLIDTSYVAKAASYLNNPLLSAPSMPATPLAAFNSIYDLLWIVRDFTEQKGNAAFPSGVLWAPSLIYFQSYTVYIAMVIFPFTRPAWHVQGMFVFALGSFWFDSWGWYSAAGLLIADLSVSPYWQSRLIRGIKITNGIRCPVWGPAMLSVAVGLALKYTWTAALPQYLKGELILHPSLSLSADVTYDNFPTSQPYARVDDFLIVVGFLLLIETLQRAQAILSSKLLVFLGRRSLSKSSQTWITTPANSALHRCFGCTVLNYLHCWSEIFCLPPRQQVTVCGGRERSCLCDDAAGGGRRCGDLLQDGRRTSKLVRWSFLHVD